MKKAIFLVSFLTIAILHADANTRRVGFFGPFVSNVDYSTFNVAVNAAVAGDTILVFPGNSTGSLAISKKLFIFAEGDFLDTAGNPRGNANMQATTGTATAGNITFAPGSDGSFIEGFYGGSYYIQANNITIARNREMTVYLNNGVVNYSSLKIIENYRVTVTAANANGSVISGLLVSNNLMNNFSTIAGNSYSGEISFNVWAFDYTLSAGNANGGTNTMSSTNSIELGNGQYGIEANIFAAYQSSTVSNNFLRYSFSNGGNSIYNNNMALETATPPNWGTGTGNVITPIANYASIFVGFPAIGTNSADARYKLAAGSPAATVAAGKPIGMYGSVAPYKLSLIPPIPTIYKLSSPQGPNPTGNTFTVNVSLRGNN